MIPEPARILELGKRVKLESSGSGISWLWVEELVRKIPVRESLVLSKEPWAKEAQTVTYRINWRRNIPRHILIKLTKTKHKERILKAAREKQQVAYKGNHICLTAALSAETLQARREWQDIKYWKGKINNQDYSTWQRSHSKLMEK